MSKQDVMAVAFACSLGIIMALLTISVRLKEINQTLQNKEDVQCMQQKEKE